MKVKMLATRRGSEDGFTVKQYHENEVYELRDCLAKSFLAAGFAIPIWEEKKTNDSGKKRVWARKKITKPAKEIRTNINSCLEKLKLRLG